MEGYAKSTIDVLKQCEEALRSIQKCVAYDGTVCAPNNDDLLLVAMAIAAIMEYFELRDIKPLVLK